MNDAIRKAIEELKSAFPPHPLDTERTPADWREFYGSAGPFTAGAHGKRWDELTPAFLEFHREVLAYFELPALIEVLPAYLAVALQRSPELDMIPTFLLGEICPQSRSKRFDAFFLRLTLVQKQAITHALEAWAEALEDRPRLRAEVEGAANYWRTIRSEQ